VTDARVLFVAYDAEGHVGQHLMEAASRLHIHHRVMSPAAAFDASWLVSKINWHVRGHRPTRLEQFGARAVEVADAIQATHVVATGIVPLPETAVRAMRNAGIRIVNWLTDDPWNAAHRAPWFTKTIPEYDVIYTPRAANVDQLRAAGARNVQIMPFGYCSHCHFVMQKREQSRDVVSFVGGADKDRVRYINALARAGIRLELYGGYWKEERALQQYAKGFVDMAGYRAIAANTAVSLNLVREANRDGHVMRSYELPAMRACILAQDTPDHRELYGADGEAVRYFTSARDISAVAREMLANPAERDRLAMAGHTRVVRPENSYYARLETLLHEGHEGL
jgi:spore maturation protein CgeB